jgi:hypothetical protein
MRRIGQLSYSWYLWHWPVLVLAAVALDHPLTWWQATLAVVGSYALSVLSYRFVESTLRYAPTLQSPRRSMMLGVGLTLVAALAAGALVRSADESETHTGVISGTERVGRSVFEVAPDVTVDVDTGKVSEPKKLTPSPDEAPTDRFAELYDQGCQADQPVVTVTNCVMGKKSSKTTMVLIGDSHAAAWAPALDMVAIDRKWRMVPMTKAGCAAGLFPVFNPTLNRAYPECDTWRTNALQRIESLHPDLIVVSNRADYRIPDDDGNAVSFAASMSAVESGTIAMLEKLQATGAKVVYLIDAPRPPFDVPTCVSKHGSDYSACDFPRDDAVDAADTLAASVSAAIEPRGGSVVNLIDVMCPDTSDTCPSVSGNILRYRDTNHMTATFARSLAPQLLAALPAKL